MPEINIREKTPIVWADLTDYSSAISGLTRTAQIDLTGITNGLARQGAQVNLGNLRFHEYLIAVGLEFLTTATPAERANLYFGQSFAAGGRPGDLGAADADYAPTNPDLAAGLGQLGDPFPFVLDDKIEADGIQFQFVGRILTPLQFIIPVLHLDTATADLFTDAVEMFIALIPLTPESQ